MVEKQKVFAYITRGDMLLVFKHRDFPAAGIQVPAGTVEPGETPEGAVMREATEETGLTDLVLGSFLGVCERDMSDYGIHEIHRRSFFHVFCQSDCPPTWSRDETSPSDGSPGPITFDFYWVQLPHRVPDLIGDHGQFLNELITRMNASR